MCSLGESDAWKWNHEIADELNGRRNKEAKKWGYCKRNERSIEITYEEYRKGNGESLDTGINQS